MKIPDYTFQFNFFLYICVKKIKDHAIEKKEYSTT